MPENQTRQEILEKSILETEQQIARLEAELQGTRGLLEASRDELTRVREDNARANLEPLIVDAPFQSSAAKIALFRSLFQGRLDVFSRLWTNSRTGKRGYAPACANEWVRGVCEKPRIKCGECPNQAFVRFGDQVILDHLRGRDVVGVYPLLADETCWLLAIDLDKGSWTEDVTALRETCRNIGVHAAVERSRSGNGAHVWFFFRAPVPATTARRMGCHIVTETMSRRHQLSMDSYDRLFPNQDTMPRGGFGNLIALPFQHEPRQAGNTVFLDDQMLPHSDQWAYLASIPRLAPPDVDRIATEAQRKGLVVGVRTADPAEDDVNVAPWDRSPSRLTPRLQITQPLPKNILAVLAQRLFVEKEDSALPSREPDQALGRIPKSGVLQTPESPSVDGPDAARDLVRRGARRSRGTASRLSNRSRQPAPGVWHRARRSRTSA